MSSPINSYLSKIIGRFPVSINGLVLTLGLVGFVAVGQQSKNAIPGPEKIVEEQVEAYNRNDIEAFLKTYAPEFKFYTYPGEVTGTGLKSMREIYAKVFADNASLKVKIAKRIVQGEDVIDHEESSGIGRELKSVAIYGVKDGKIIGIRFLE